jgi:hypothetical protein
VPPRAKKKKGQKGVTRKKKEQGRSKYKYEYKYWPMQKSNASNDWLSGRDNLSELSPALSGTAGSFSS